MNPTDEQLGTLRHMLGITDRCMKDPLPYRDYYAAPCGDAELLAMADAGLVERYAADPRYDWYRTTAAGRAAAMASHKRIRASKGRRMYSQFLSVRDCWPELTFRQFLTHPELRETRQGA